MVSLLTSVIARAPGPSGDAGSPGLTTTFNSGFLFVMHSQSDTLPSCPADTTQLWTVCCTWRAKRKPTHWTSVRQAGSCMRLFSTMPYSYCNMGMCDYASRNDKS
ncbi:unnamed protein product [Coregonus sp. 'balchen']|nr:unnamed protein product [Coregonus sp. 'balchen']